MFTCKQCSRKFKSSAALGGHVSSAHAQNGNGAKPASDTPSPVVAEATAQAVKELPTPAVPAIPAIPAVSPESETGIMDTIRQYKGRGWSAGQVKALGYKRQTVDQVFLEGVVPEGNPNEGEQSENDEFPLVTRGTEIITPEGIMRRLADGSDDWALRYEGMMLLRAAQRMNRDDIEMSKMQSEAYAAMIKPTLELMEKNREAQDAAAARARESSIEIAERAAFATAQDMKGAFSSEMQGLKASLPGTPEPSNPMMQAFLTAMQPFLGQIFQRMFSNLPGAVSQPGPSPQQSLASTEMKGQTAQTATANEAWPGAKPGEKNEFSEI